MPVIEGRALELCLFYFHKISLKSVIATQKDQLGAKAINLVSAGTDSMGTCKS